MMRVLGGELHETRYDRLLLPQPEQPRAGDGEPHRRRVRHPQDPEQGSQRRDLAPPLRAKALESEIFAENAFAFDGGVGLSSTRCRTRGREGACVCVWNTGRRQRAWCMWLTSDTVRVRIMSAVEIGRAVAQLPLLLLHPVAVAVLLAVFALPLLLPKVLLVRS